MKTFHLFTFSADKVEKTKLPKLWQCS